MTKTKQKKKSKKFHQGELEKKIHRILKYNSKKTFKPTRIAGRLKIKNTKESIAQALDKLVEKGKARKVKNDGYQYTDRTYANDDSGKKLRHTGRVDIIRSGAGYVRTEDEMEDIYIGRKRLKTAMHGDLVEVMLEKWRHRPEGRVVKILERAQKKYVGTCRNYGRKLYALVSHQSAEFDIEIIGEQKANDGDRVIVKIIHFSGNGRMKGEIDQVLSIDKPHDLEMNSILINEGFDIVFSEEVLKAASNLSSKLTDDDLKQRKDLRALPTFTIDPVDAKDFDDAISYRTLENGHAEIGVHIADVSHFVKEGSEIDKEAYSRSTSVYLVDRVCPMLPEKLSNELCSLRPNEDKFTFSTLFTFNEKGKIVEKWFGKTLIHSDRRFTYEEAQEIIEAGEGDFCDELVALNKMAIRLRQNRFRNGSIKFETDEVRFHLDPNNEPIDVYVKERKDAHLLVEDFMLLANREVAAFIHNRKKTPEIPFVYRIHDQPDPEKLKDFALLAQEFGLKLNLNTPKEVARSFNEMTDKLENPDDIGILMPLAIRTMAKAEYSTDNIGHYGLAFPTYTHFTSPIRRYADLIAHRILHKNLDEELRENKAALEEKCKHISRQERRAIDAERESIKYMQVVFMQNKVGQIFDARISGIIARGIFVEVMESHAEGLIPFRQMGRLKAISSSSALVDTEIGEKKFRFGDKLKVQLIDIDLPKKQLDFKLPTD